MKVRFNTVAASPVYTAHPGDVLDLPTEEALGLIAVGYAERVEPEHRDHETAMTAPPRGRSTR